MNYIYISLLFCFAAKCLRCTQGSNHLFSRPLAHDVMRFVEKSRHEKLDALLITNGWKKKKKKSSDFSRLGLVIIMTMALRGCEREMKGSQHLPCSPIRQP